MHRSLVGLLVLPFLALATPAHGAEVTLWACAGPGGTGLGKGPIVTAQTSSGDCLGTPLSSTSLRMTVPADLVSVSVDRRAQGPGYVATAGGELERIDDASMRDGVLAGPASGRELVLSGGTTTLRSAALTVDDSTRPTATVALPNRASGTLSVPVDAADTGVGLASVIATIDGAPAASAAFGVCAELSPGDATIDRAFGGDCPASAKTTLSIDTTKFASGDRTLLIRTTDAAGNRQDFFWGLKIDNPVVEQPTAEPAATETATPIVQARHTPSPTPTPTPTATPEGAVLSEEAVRYTTRDFLRIPSRPRISKRGTLTFTARCPLTKTCALRVSLTWAGKTLASGRVSVRPGKTKQLTLKLSKAALKRRGTQDMRVTVAGYRGVAIRVR